MAKELLFSVTAKDCKWDYFRAPGPGGQHKNKTESAVRCTHIASGAVGQATESRSQHENKRKAFVRMAESDTFKKWHRLECMRRLGQLVEIEETVDKMMKDVKIEGVADGKWVEIE